MFIGALLRTAGVAPLALAYAAGFVLLWQRARAARWLAIFAPVGRMALTNYLAQSIIGTGLCFGIGLGLGYISPVSTLVKWFPDRRGMATGMAIMLTMSGRSCKGVCS